jgi:ABC-type glycerol-3-phosphate transport system substrate-binding protein
MSRKMPPVAIAVVAVALAGCGGSDKSSSNTSATTSTTTLSHAQYQARLAAANQAVTRAENALQTTLRSKSITPAGAGAAIATFGAVQQKLGDGFASLKPPTNAQAANELLAKGLHDQAAEASKLSAKLKKAKTRSEAVALLKSVSGTTTGGKEVDKAVKELHGLGYKRLG